MSISRPTNPSETRRLTPCHTKEASTGNIRTPADIVICQTRKNTKANAGTVTAVTALAFLMTDVPTPRTQKRMEKKDVSIDAEKARANNRNQ
jgi:hypothetical protein